METINFAMVHIPDQHTIGFPLEPIHLPNVLNHGGDVIHGFLGSSE